MPVSTCALCGEKDLKIVIDLGKHPLADTFLKSEKEAADMRRYPLQMLLCLNCSHAMNSYVVSGKERYQDNEYSYDSSNSKVSIAHFGEMAADVIRANNVREDDLVVDIGGNVGTLLAAFKEKAHTRVLNVEPAPNIADIAEKNGIPTERDFFNDAVSKKIEAMGGAKAIMSTNAFNHIDGLDDFMHAVVRALKPDGVFVFEVPYLLLLVEKLAFDTIYLEHISYFAIKPLRAYFKKFGLTITEVVVNEYMGGSMRVAVSCVGTESASVAEWIVKEEAAELFSIATYKKMTKQIEAFKDKLLMELASAKKAGGRIIGIGAATKGNTLLNYCGIDATMLEFVTDASPLKVGKYTPGSHIPIRPDEAITDEITHALILPWNIAEFLKGKLSPKFPNLAFIVPHMRE